VEKYFFQKTPPVFRIFLGHRVRNKNACHWGIFADSKKNHKHFGTFFSKTKKNFFFSAYGSFGCTHFSLNRKKKQKKETHLYLLSFHRTKNPKFLKSCHVGIECGIFFTFSQIELHEKHY
jgi:hypothetical protein